MFPRQWYSVCFYLGAGVTKEAAKILFVLVHRLCSFYYEKFTLQTKVQGKVYEPKRIHHTVSININI